MNRNKNLLILYDLLKKLSKFSNAQKNVFRAFCFQLGFPKLVRINLVWTI